MRRPFLRDFKRAISNTNQLRDLIQEMISPIRRRPVDSDATFLMLGDATLDMQTITVRRGNP